MSASGQIVFGGGWKKRRDHRLKFKAISCLVLAITTFIATVESDSQIGGWVFLIPTALLLASIILFRYERPQIFWGFPNARPHDLHNLH